MYFNNLAMLSDYTGQLPKIIQFPLETLLFFFGNGNLSVSLFFVLSGFVLSYSYCVSPSLEMLIGYSLKRYLRLTLPILVAVLTISLLISFHFFYSKNELIALAIPGKLPFYDGMIETNLWIALREGLYDCHLNGTFFHNDVLWTMSVEF